jgi:hypothetical protein
VLAVSGNTVRPSCLSSPRRYGPPGRSRWPRRSPCCAGPARGFPGGRPPVRPGRLIRVRGAGPHRGLERDLRALADIWKPPDHADGEARCGGRLRVGGAARRARSAAGLAVFGALTGISALVARFPGIRWLGDIRGPLRTSRRDLASRPAAAPVLPRTYRSPLRPASRTPPVAGHRSPAISAELAAARCRLTGSRRTRLLTGGIACFYN